MFADRDDRGFVEARSRRKVVDSVGCGVSFDLGQSRFELAERAGVRDVAGDIEHTGGELRPRVGSEILARGFGGRLGEFRPPSVVAVLGGEIPTTFAPADNRPLRNSEYKAGISLRLVKSPEAPKITMVGGKAELLAELLAAGMRGPGLACSLKKRSCRACGSGRLAGLWFGSPYLMRQRAGDGMLDLRAWHGVCFCWFLSAPANCAVLAFRPVRRCRGLLELR